MPDLDRLRRRLRESLKAALSARDGVAVAALRSAISAIDNAEAVDPSREPVLGGGIIAGARLGVGAGEVGRRELSAAEVLEIVRAEIAERMAAAAEYERLGRAEQAGRLIAEASALTTFIETAVSDP